VAAKLPTQLMFPDFGNSARFPMCNMRESRRQNYYIICEKDLVDARRPGISGGWWNLLLLLSPMLVNDDDEDEGYFEWFEWRSQRKQAGKEALPPYLS